PYHSEHDQYLKNFLDTGEAKIIGIGREIRGLRKDGTEFHAELAVSEMTVNGRRSFVGIIRDITERKDAEKIIAQQHNNLLELSTPVLKVWDQVVLLPLIGRIDEDRAAQIIENLLEAIVKTEARVAVIDVTGVPEIDTFFAGHLIKTVSAAKMLGAEVLVTGVSPAIAQTLIRLGADLSTITACGPLKEGIARALGALGIMPGQSADDSGEDRSVSLRRYRFSNSGKFY
ncbi:MAG: PAS domain S-box protein, partial [Rhodospirillales bacterium]|nr:PAS domain S-box protein [Rhodospirillales bacterium]